jgi:hypothetical protein
MVVRPKEMVVYHAGDAVRGARPSGKPELVSKRGSQVRGGMAATIGGALIWFALGRPREGK